MKPIIVKAPDEYSQNGIKVFLAGSIEMDTAEKWQEQICKKLSNLDLIILNPRRDNWDSTITQTAISPQLNVQVNWELTALENADLILMYFDPHTKSAITLLELGLFHQKPILVCCPDGFWRQGNVEIVCQKYGVTLVKDKETFFAQAHELCQKLINKI